MHPYILYGIEIDANTKSTYHDKLIKLNKKNFLEYFKIDQLLLLYANYTSLIISAG